MKERIHEQIGNDLKQATRMDIIIVIVAIVVSFILFSLSMGFAFASTNSVMSTLTKMAAKSVNTAPTIIMFLCVGASVAIDFFAVRNLLKNKARRVKLNEGLMKLYKEEGMDQYYDGSIFKGYETRYNLYAIILTAVGAVSVIAPLVIFINQIVEL
jgi:multidrug transporter EmrE-like cation transporter